MKVTHPDFPELSHEVSDADRWVAAGWIADEPATACPTCGAVDDEPCTTSAGNDTTRHATRA